MKRIAALSLALGVASTLGACSSMGRGVSDTARMTRTGAREAVVAPLKDFNLVRQKVPPILVAADKEPYKLPERTDCAWLAHEIGQLDLALGPDVDMPREGDALGVTSRGSRAASDAALDAVRDLTTGWIPFRSTVRRLTGAANNQDMVEDAVFAGGVRRAYLKGIGLQQGCTHPASPLPAAANPQVATRDRWGRRVTSRRAPSAQATGEIAAPAADVDAAGSAPTAAPSTAQPETPVIAPSPPAAQSPASPGA